MFAWLCDEQLSNSADEYGQVPRLPWLTLHGSLRDHTTPKYMYSKHLIDSDLISPIITNW